MKDSKKQLIAAIQACHDMELIQKIADFVQAEKMKVKEEPATYEKEEVMEVEQMSPDFQKAIKEGIKDADAGRVLTQEEDRKYWDKWFKEN